MLKNISIYNRLRIVIIIAMSGAALVAIQGCYDLYIAMQVMKKNYDSPIHSSQDLNTISNMLGQSVLLLEQASSLDKLIHSSESNQKQDFYPIVLKNISSQIDQKIETITILWTNYIKSINTTDEKTTIEAFNRAFMDSFKQQVQLSHALNQTITPEKIEQRVASANITLDTMQQSLSALNAQQSEKLKISRAQYESIFSLFLQLVLGCIVFVCALIILLYWISWNIFQTIHKYLGASPEALNKYAYELLMLNPNKDPLRSKRIQLDVKTAINTMQENIARLLVETQQIQYGISIGDLQTRANSQQHTKDYRKVLDTFNIILDQILLNHSVSETIKAPPSLSATLHTSQIQGNTQELADLSLELKQILQDISQGNTDLRIRTEDKSGDMLVISQDLNTLIDSITSTPESLSNNDALNESSESIRIFAEEAMIASMQLAQMNTSQLSALQYAANHMQYLADSIEQNRQTTQQAHQLTLDILQSAHNEEIEFQAIATAIDSINKNTQKIQSQISIIDNIALQGDILAFNVAIEAARFGDEGRGFSVIATEVRNLSQRAISSTQTMKDLISDAYIMAGDGSQHLLQAEQSAQQILNHSNEVEHYARAIVKNSDQHVHDLRDLVQAGEIAYSNGVQQSMLHEFSRSKSISLLKQADSLNGAKRSTLQDNQTSSSLLTPESTEILNPPIETEISVRVNQLDGDALTPNKDYPIPNTELNTDFAIQSDRPAISRPAQQPNSSKSQAAENEWILF